MSEECTNDEIQPGRETLVIAKKQRKIFEGYIKWAFWCFILAIATGLGTIVILIIAFLYSIKTWCCYRQLIKFGSVDVFGESGKPLVWSMLLTLTLFLSIVKLQFVIGVDWYSIYGSENLLEVHKALNDYAANNDLAYPQKNWYETLFPGDKKNVFRSDQPSVVLNPEALKLGMEIPDDMVLGFTRRGSWGQIGVFEKEKENDLINGIIVLFGDGSTDKAIYSQGKYLRWNNEGVNNPEVNGIGFSCIALSVLIVCMTIIVKHRLIFDNRIVDLFGAMFVAVALGGFFLGVHLASFHIIFDSLYNIVYVGGTSVILCMLLASAYLPLMVVLKQKCRYKYFKSRTIVYGALTGVLCSTVLHVLLGFLFLDNSTIPALAGAPFGAWSGMIVGWVTGNLLSKADGSDIEEKVVGDIYTENFRRKDG